MKGLELLGALPGRGASPSGKGIAANLFMGIGMKLMEKVDGPQLERLKAAVEAP